MKYRGFPVALSSIESESRSLSLSSQCSLKKILSLPLRKFHCAIPTSALQSDADITDIGSPVRDDLTTSKDVTVAINREASCLGCSGLTHQIGSAWEGLGFAMFGVPLQSKLRRR